MPVLQFGGLCGFWEKDVFRSLRPWYPLRVGGLSGGMFYKVSPLVAPLLRVFVPLKGL
ncbi:hypothetical protein TRIATDRAFT_260210 [Trichoderma atroviride IMI 206040]|uniref:Uncharacterized protein n=1 Tax=Hypocrea atroviridis (strain ATCC 20476 / IMI 206040) TaxID=452589 RepID=G9PCA3_HYPAI|nr:uncharacterized protein TRIATDRAFT_260210 [Trichoderma atroviride IMI 206040]EHK39478.1 hypothetical protein TRIATDRAFT_260210 [Trichoderma atroviride IMI 206040]